MGQKASMIVLGLIRYKVEAKSYIEKYFNRNRRPMKPVILLKEKLFRERKAIKKK